MNNEEFLKQYVDYIGYTKSQPVNIETTYRCPLQCPFCQRQEEPKLFKERIKKSDDMTIEDFVKVMEHHSEISFCGQISDPLTHPKFLDILEICFKNKHKKFFINTTGTRKKQEWWRKAFSLTGSHMTWIFGLDGTDQETANIYRVNTRFDEVMNAMKLGSSMDKHIQWSFIVFKHNEHQIEKAKEIAKENKFDLRMVKSGRWRESDMKKYNIYPPSDQWKSSNSITKFIKIKLI
jgi:MoaA/NifB/PqqE/SkfB family radical SAM enzyme